MRKISFAMAGNSGPQDEYNPYTVTGNEVVEEILYYTNRKLLGITDLAKVTKRDKNEIETGINALKRIGFIRGEEKFAPTIPIFTKEDMLIPEVEAFPKAIGKKIVEVIKENRQRIKRSVEELDVANKFEVKDLLFIIIGFYILDTGMLDKFYENNLLILKKRSGDRAYTFWGVEVGSKTVTPTPAYRRGHIGADFPLLGIGAFGNSGGPRENFPDIAWRIRDEKKRMKWMKEINTLLLATNGKAMNIADLTSTTKIAAEKIVKHIKLLDKLALVKEFDNKYSANFPIFTKEDMKKIQALVHEISAKITKNLKDYYEAMLRIYSKMQAGRNGVDFREAFNPIYHNSFSWANALLIEEGFFNEPPEHPDKLKYAIWGWIKQREAPVPLK